MITLRCRPLPHDPLQAPEDTAATEILLGRGLLAELPKLARERRGRPPFLLIDKAVAALLPASATPGWHRHELAAGEAIKTLTVAEQVLRAMVAAGLDRSDLLIAMGGGSVGDLGGLCAGLYLRGIEIWQVPTTLLAMVDSAVGGKTAVNLPEGKNLVGLVHSPSRVVVDLDCLRELPEEQFDSGLAEIIKAAIGLDGALFNLLEQQHDAVRARDPAVLESIVERALAAKIAVVESDLEEAGPRRLLNLGHTLGHALEAHARNRLPHGLCVARGLHFAVEVAASLGRIAPTDADRCRGLLLAYGHQRSPLPPRQELRPFLERDKKVLADSVQFVLPTGIGSCETRPLKLEDLLTGAGWD